MYNSGSDVDNEETCMCQGKGYIGNRTSTLNFIVNLKTTLKN